MPELRRLGWAVGLKRANAELRQFGAASVWRSGRRSGCRSDLDDPASLEERLFFSTSIR